MKCVCLSKCSSWHAHPLVVLQNVVVRVGGGWEPMSEYLVQHARSRFKHRSRSFYENEAYEAVQTYRDIAGVGLSKPMTEVGSLLKGLCTTQSVHEQKEGREQREWRKEKVDLRPVYISCCTMHSSPLPLPTPLRPCLIVN